MIRNEFLIRKDWILLGGLIFFSPKLLIQLNKSLDLILFFDKLYFRFH